MKDIRTLRHGRGNLETELSRNLTIRTDFSTRRAFSALELGLNIFSY